MRFLRVSDLCLVVLCLLLSNLGFWVGVAYPSDEEISGETVPEVRSIKVEDVKSNETGWIRISWEPLDIPGLDHYLVYRSEIGMGRERYDLGVIGWTNETSFVDGSPKNGSEYFYGVTAVDQSGNEGRLGELAGPISPKDDVPPRIDLLSLIPAPGDNEVSTSFSLEFTVSDGGYGVDLENVSVKLKERSYKAGISGFYYDGDISAYKVKVVPGFLFENGDTVVVEISASDLSPEPNRAKPLVYRFVTELWSFASFEIFDVSAGGGVNLLYENLRVYVPPDTSLKSFHLKAGIARTSVALPPGAIGSGETYSLEVPDGLGNQVDFSVWLSLPERILEAIPDKKLFLMFLPSRGKGWQRLEGASDSEGSMEARISGSGALQICFHDEKGSPYIADRFPEVGEDGVPIDIEKIWLKLKDDGAGIDISSIDVDLRINGNEFSPELLVTGDKLSCEVNCSLDNLVFSHADTVVVHIMAEDLSLKANILDDDYYFVIEPDRFPPVIDMTGAGEAVYSDSYNLTARVKDEAPLEDITVEIFYRKGGEKEFRISPMSVQGDGTFKGSIPQEFATFRGIELYIRASDGRNEAFYPDGYPDTVPLSIPVRVPETELRRRLSEIQNGDPSKIVSLPLKLDFLQDDSSPEDLDSIPLDPGMGFRVGDLQRLETKIITGLSVRTDLSHRISLSPGWNTIGCPFAFPVSWSTILEESGHPNDVEVPWHLDRDGYQRVYALVPWEGYQVKNISDSEVVLKIPPSEYSTETHLAAPFYTWQLKISASSSGLSDVDNFAGVSEGSSLLWDRRDFAEPPPSEDQSLSLYFPHGNWELNPGNYAGDYQPPSEGHSWHLELNYKLEIISDITLEIKGLHDIPRDFEVSLFNLDSFESIHMDENGTSVLKPATSQGTLGLSLIVGTGNYSDRFRSTMGDSLGVKGEFMAFPNPFNSSTLVRFYVPQPKVDEELPSSQLIIYNMLGQEVRKLVDERKAPGLYSVEWDGRDSEGRSVGTGVYFLKLEIGDFEAIERVVLIR